MNPFIDKKIRKNIKIVSVIDRFLEHPRIYYFRNNGNEEVYVGSADMMPRNLDRRIELLFPVDSEEIKVDLKAIVKCALNDRRKGRHLIKPNYYSRTNKALKYEKTRSQIKLYEYYLSKYKNFQNETRPSNETIKIYRHPPSHIGK
jgi:polyphosphate kinase